MNNIVTGFINATPVMSTVKKQKCPMCGGKYFANMDIWKYTVRPRKGKRMLVCSYRCMNAMKNKLAEEDRNVYRYFKNPDTFESMTLPLVEWAELYNIPYRDLWELVIQNKVNLRDAITILRARKDK